MTIRRKNSWTYAEKVLARPNSAVKVEIRNNKSGISLLHNKRLLTKCYNSNMGNFSAYCMGLALGSALPPQGESFVVTVSTGVLFRAISVSNLDMRVPEARILTERLLSEAAEQRRTSTEIIV